MSKKKMEGHPVKWNLMLESAHMCLRICMFVWGRKNGVYQGLFNDKPLPTWHNLMIHP